MLEQGIKNRIIDVFNKSEQKIILDFMEYLDTSGMLFERGTGYWEDKFYLLAKYKDEVVYYILLNGSENNSEPKGLTIWSGENTSDYYANPYTDEKTKETIFNHIDICCNCGGCNNPGGTPKVIFGKEFDQVCITPLKFENPDVETLECLKKLVDIQKNL